MSAQASLIHELEEAMATGSAGRQAETLRRVTDLFVSGAVRFTDEQVALFDDVIGWLAVEIETAARAELAARLAPIPNAPPHIVENLAFDDEIAVAGPVLRRSERVSEAALVQISTTSDQPHLLAIAQRKALPDVVTDVLVDRGDRAVVECIAGNAGAQFSYPGYSMLVRRAEGDDAIAARVGMRPDLPRHLFLRVMAKASEEVCKKLEAANPHPARDIKAAIAAAANRIGAATALHSHDYRAAEAQIGALRDAGRLGEREVEAFAGAQKFEEVAVALALLCGVRIEIVERALVQDRPDSVLILAKAAGLSWPAVKPLLVLRNHGRAVPAAELGQCLANFERLTRATAQQALRLPRFAAAPAR